MVPQLKVLPVLLLVVVVLSGCQGGGSDESAETKATPAAAGAADKNQAAAGGWTEDQMKTMQKVHSKEGIAAENAANGAAGMDKAGK